jgi:hypothetical protein
MRTSERPFVILRRVGEIVVGGEGGIVFVGDWVEEARECEGESDGESET